MVIITQNNKNIVTLYIYLNLRQNFRLYLEYTKEKAMRPTYLASIDS